MNGFYTCDMKTGKFERNGEWIISETAGVESIHNETGLSVVNLGAEGGYRLFYHNEERHLMMMWFTGPDNWNDGGAVSQDTAGGMAIGSAVYDKENITVVSPRGTEDIEVSGLQKTGLWSLDRHIHEATAAKNTWEMASNQSKSAWPLADDPSSGLAVVSQQSEGKAWLYYWSNKTIVQAYKNYDGDWEDAEALPEKAPKNAADSKKPDNGSS
ncbi:hypothetical protein FBEOM_4194 [Fusarium beomiforme]|uniref:Fucose-specific lectin n=1 Tax=Fusarium beomiforme TaxID=44412 RepID=A0A9P5DYC4_9HYPO|nr:hypothetical protein FBEOM_4194 [Fusarium beomiforme]